MIIHIVIWESKKRGEPRRVSATPFFISEEAKKWMARQAKINYPLEKSMGELRKTVEYYSLSITEQTIR